MTSTLHLVTEIVLLLFAGASTEYVTERGFKENLLCVNVHIWHLVAKQLWRHIFIRFYSDINYYCCYTISCRKFRISQCLPLTFSSLVCRLCRSMSKSCHLISSWSNLLDKLLLLCALKSRSICLARLTLCECNTNFIALGSCSLHSYFCTSNKSDYTPFCECRFYSNCLFSAFA